MRKQAREISSPVGAPVLSVRGLTTSFLVDGQWASVVRDVSFDVMPGETVAIVGESGSGKSVTSLSVMRLLARNASRIEGHIRLNGKDILSLSDKEMRQVRGKDAAMIFQEPMTSLNPIFTTGRQISEALTCHRKLGAGRSAGRDDPSAREGAHPQRVFALRRLSASVFRRHAPARDDRHGAGQPPEAAHRR